MQEDKCSVDDIDIPLNTGWLFCVSSHPRSPFSLPFAFGICGIVSLWIVLACNLWMVFVSIMLYVKMDAGSARKVMFSSYFYLMIVLLAIFANRMVQ
mgnify:CR=1 FL=1